VVGIIDDFALILIFRASAARAMVMATERAKATNGEGNGDTKAVIVDRSGGRWQPRQWWSSLTAVIVDGGCLGMEGRWRNGIVNNGIFGRWWRQQWWWLLSTVQQQLVPPPPSLHQRIRRWQRRHRCCRHQLPLLLRTTAIAAVDSRHCRCRTVTGERRWWS
jgi:hypothetical protein